MRASGAAILGAAVVGAGFLLASNASATPIQDEGVDFDIDAEIQLAKNYYAMAITDPEFWTAGQLHNLENFLMEMGMQQEAGNIKSLRVVLYGDNNPSPEPLPDINFIPPDVIDTIADRLESELE
jgi:hypothetical protein